MLFIEFEQEWKYGDNIIKYRNIDDDIWYYLYIDIETANLLLTKYGIISTVRKPTGFTSCDNPTTGNEIKIKYCGADISINCKNKSRFYLPYIEQDY